MFVRALPLSSRVAESVLVAAEFFSVQPAIKKFAQTHRSFINQANNTHGLGPGQGKARVDPGRYPSPG